ncbi:hypothetical protein J4G08_12915 [Candidatus Poribacteria bacterium]|nr:hypothetical protein [Candidatus Poribacteria bacterium]
MFKVFFINNWFFVGIGFILIFALGCYLWFQNDMANFRQKYAPISQLDKSAETQQSGNLQAELNETAQSVESIPVSKNIGDGTYIATGTETENTKTDTDSTLEGMNEETTSIEEAEEILSPEELRERELKKRLKEIFAQMKVLTEKAGGKVDASSDPEVRHEMQQLTTELFQIMQEGVKEEDQPAFNFFMNLMTMSNRLVNSNGEIIVSEYVKIADNMEAAGMSEMAKGIRAWAQNALDNGYEVIKPEDIQRLMAQDNN